MAVVRWCVVMGKVAVWCSGCGIVAVVRCVVMGKVAVWCSGCGSLSPCWA